MSTLVVSLHVFTAFCWVSVLYSRNKLLRQCGAKNIPGGQAMCSKRQPGLLAFPVLPARGAKPGHSWLPVWTETKRKGPAGCTHGTGSKLVLLMHQAQGDGAVSLEGREGPNHRIKMQKEWLLGLSGLQVCFGWPCTVWPASYFKFKLAVNFLNIRKFHIKKVGTFAFMQKLRASYSCISVMTDAEKQLPHKEASVGHVTIVPAVPQ